MTHRLNPGNGLISFRNDYRLSLFHELQQRAQLVFGFSDRGRLHLAKIAIIKWAVKRFPCRSSIKASFVLKAGNCPKCDKEFHFFFVRNEVTTEQYIWPAQSFLNDAHLVFVFGLRDQLEVPGFTSELKRRYPQAILFGCSSAGEIMGTSIVQGPVITALQLARTSLQLASSVVEPGQCYNVGRQLAASVGHKNLQHALVLSEGLQVNGTEIARGLRDVLPENVAITGGLAADGELFQRTVVLSERGVQQGQIALLGFYGTSLHVGFGSLGGWDPFGPDRLITRSDGNILHELDSENALSLYKRYLGKHAADLPASGLLFPMHLQYPHSGQRVVRTLLGVNENDQSLIFAGDMPEGCYATLMKANLDRLIDGASAAAAQAIRPLRNSQPDVALLISCVGRRMLLKGRTEDELDAVREVLGENTIMTGFYSYGELSPLSDEVSCELHNQTMTITTFKEL